MAPLSPRTPRPARGPRRRAALAAVAAVALAALLAACGSEGVSGGVEVEKDLATAVDDTSPPATTAPGAPATTRAPATTTTTEPPTTTTTAPPAAVAGSALPAGANTVYVLGDSVTLGAQATVPPALAGWSVTFDAEENRRIDQGTSILQARGGSVGRALVVHLCTNWGGGDYAGAADRLMDSVAGADRVVWVTCTPWLPAVGAANDEIRALPQRYPEVVVADWAAVSATPGYTYSDGLHLQSAGAQALAALIADTLGPAPTPG